MTSEETFELSIPAKPEQPNEIGVAIPDSPGSDHEIINRVDWLIDKIHKCEQAKLACMLEIYQNQYWKLDFSSFELFCKERLGFSKQYVYRCINAAKMLEAGVPVANPNQSLALEGLDIEQAKEVWDRAAEVAEESGKKVTAGMLKRARNNKELVDRAASGTIDITLLSEPFMEIVASLRECKELLQLICNSQDGVWMSYQPMAVKLRDIAETVKFATPHTQCPQCSGSGCASCRDLGWIPKAREIASDQ